MWGTRAKGVTLIGLMVGVSLAAGIALADEPNPFAAECKRTATDEDLEGAKGAHRAARQFYERGEYARAIQYWKDVFNFDCNALGTLLNIANAYEKLGDRKNAILALEAYLKRDPQADDAQKIQTRIENLRSLLSSQPTATASVGPVPTSTPTAIPTAPPPPQKPFGVAPWVTVGVGGAALIAGGILTTVGYVNIDSVLLPLGDRANDGTHEAAFQDEAYKNAQKKNLQTCYERYDNSGTYYCWSQDSATRATQAQTMVLTGKILLGVGGAAVVGGLLWEFMANKPVQPNAGKDAAAKNTKVRVTPSVGPGMSGVTVSGSF
jgi:tetratricopeptide (TPR) repeat protein